MERDKDKLKGPIETEFDYDTTELAAPSMILQGPRGTKRKYSAIPDAYARTVPMIDMMDPKVMKDAIEFRSTDELMADTENHGDIPPGEIVLHEQFMGPDHPRGPVVRTEDGLVENVIENAMGSVGGEAEYATDKVQDAARAAKRQVEQAKDHLSGNTDKEQDKAKDVTRDAQNEVKKLGNKADGGGRDLEGSASTASRDAHGEAANLGDRAKYALEDDSDSVKRNVDNAERAAKDSSKDVQRKAEDAGDPDRETAHD